MKKIIDSLIIFLLISSSLFSQNSDFKTNQLKYERVRDAYQTKENTVKGYLKEKGINDCDFKLYLRVFKQEKCVEVWVKPNASNEFIHLLDYDICSSSGSLGPKRQEGDGQVPEGAYYINRFNPSSNFHLSLGLNYPNASDAVRGKQGALGGDIFIHGSCVTIGCIPLTDDKIKEVYILAIEAKQHGQSKIPVHIFPFRMENEKFDQIKKDKSYANLITFWEELYPVYQKFEQTKKLPVVNISSGKYIVN